MDFRQLVKTLDQHGIKVALLPTGKLKLKASQEPPAEVLEAIDRYRHLLVRRMEEGKDAQGHYHLSDLEQVPGLCASCVHRQPIDHPRDLLGRCTARNGPHCRHASQPCPPEVNAWAPAQHMVEGAA